MKKLIITFEQEKETKGAVRYAEVTVKGKEDAYAVGTLYLRKSAIGEPPYPQTLTVTIST
jgi:hypothetical protein